MFKVNGTQAFATIALCLMAVVGCAAISTDQAHDPAAPDWTVARCDVVHLPAYTRTDICVSATGNLVPRVTH